MLRLNPLSLVVLILMLSLGGCATAKIDKSTKGDLFIPASEVAHQAKDVMNEYGFDIRSVDHNDGVFRLNGKHPDSQEVEVNIVSLRAESSNLHIQVTNRSPHISAKVIFDDIAARYE